MAHIAIQNYMALVPTLREAPSGTMWSTYDEMSDTLYINFKRPSIASDSELTDDDVVVRYHGDEVIGLTILHASKR